MHQTPAKSPRTSGPPSLPCVIRAEWTAYLMALVFLAPAVWGLPNVVRDSSYRTPILIFTVIALAWTWYMSTFRIELDDQVLRYEEPFRPPREVTYTNIDKLEVVFKYIRGPMRWGGMSLLPIRRLSIHDSDSHKSLEVNMKVFSEKDVALIVETIATKSPSVTMDRGIARLRAGHEVGMPLALVKLLVLLTLGVGVFWLVFFLVIRLVADMILRLHIPGTEAVSIFLFKCSFPMLFIVLGVDAIRTKKVLYRWSEPVTGRRAVQLGYVYILIALGVLVFMFTVLKL